MTTPAKKIDSGGNFFERIARARMQSTLLSMGRVWVERHGYSWELLRAGTAYWPWRQTLEAVAGKPGTRRAGLDLKQCRGIETPLRYASAENDGEPRQKSVA